MNKVTKKFVSPNCTTCNREYGTRYLSITLLTIPHLPIIYAEVVLGIHTQEIGKRIVQSYFILVTVC